MIGKTLSHYKVLEKIGQGGMGEVYRAEDTNLSREVAIKVLPEQFTQDPQRLARFEREAKLLAQLNHPNIAAIHSFEHADDVHFLVLELVPGDTLAEKVAKGPLPVEEALEVCRQIAEGVEAAHEKGVIHRDLKPANVKVTPEGKVKILDFGLAKAFEAEPPVTDISQSPTLTEEMTRAGVILGTAAYMSPEQAKGKPVDKRADIFAFGCVLFELLTGKRAFQGETITETLGAIIHKEPNWDVLPGSVPSTIRFLLSRCLKKDLTRRLQHMDGARVLIDEVLSGTSTASPIGVPSPVQSTNWRRTIPWGLAGLIALFALWSPWDSKRSESTPVRRFAVDIEPTEPIQTNGVSANLTLSPDGRRLVYAARVDGTTQLYTRPIDQLEAQPIPDTEGAYRPFFSPDGEWVGFFTLGSDRKLKKVSLRGGEARTLCDVRSPSTGSWASDNTIVFSSRGDSGEQLFRVSATGGTPQVLTTPNRERGERSHSGPEILPGGHSVLFTISSAGYRARNIAVLSLETGEYQTLIERGYNAHYAPSGHVVFVREAELWAVPFDLGRLEKTGAEAPILQGIQVDERRQSVPFSFSDDGLLVYVPGDYVDKGPKRRLVWVDRQGREEPLAAEAARYTRPQLSPDGSRLAVDITDSDNSDIWIYDLARKTFSRLTFDPARDELPVWTPDNLRVIFSSTRGGGAFNLFWKAADGTGQVERLTTSTNDQFAHSCSLNGDTLLFCGPTRGSTPFDLGVMQLGNESSAKPLLETQFIHEVVPIISPDGHWVAYQSNESGRGEVYVRPFPNAEEGQWQVSRGGGFTPVWGPDGRKLFYRSGQAMMVVAIETEPTFAAGSPEFLFTDRYYANVGLYFDISRDGQRFLMMQEVEQTQETSTQLIFVENWFEELKRLVPTP